MPKAKQVEETVEVLTDAEQLAKLNAETKALNAKRKEIRERQKANQGKNAEARKARAKSRKEVTALKANLRTLLSCTTKAFSEGDDAIVKLADEITEASALVSGCLKRSLLKVEEVEDSSGL